MFKKIFGSMIFVIIAVFITSVVLTGCKSKSKGEGETLTYEEADPNDPNNGGQTIPTTGSGGLHPLFSGGLGVPVSKSSLGLVLNDETGFDLETDWDGDGIPNDDEMLSSEYVADYPRIVTRISAPITMEIRKSETNTTENHTETLEDTNTKNTITNSMEDKQYTQANQKTTPIPTKESMSDSASHSEAHGWSASVSASFKGATYGGSVSASASKNDSFADSFAKSNMSETTLFKDVDYSDNLDKNGVEFTNSTIKDIVKNYRSSDVSKSDFVVGPNAGIVRAALYIKNLTVNMPVLVSNILCTLSFRTSGGAYLPVKTFTLRRDDYSVYEQEIYGDEEFGPYTIEITDLNTSEVKKALANGYVPQIHVVSYDLRPVLDSNYHPGVQNLKIIEETAKGRTATIKIVGNGMRDIYKVAAFDVNLPGQTVSPGISLKKALFNIFRRKIGNKEDWGELDLNGKDLTIADNGLKWKAEPADPNKYTFSSNMKGNSWDKFETYVKTYTDEYNQPHYIETIKRIGSLKKYNPFDPSDNTSYETNQLLSDSEVAKMKYWIVFHNGRYFEGDINDPIWAGERYELVLFDVSDFKQHFETFSYSPLQSMEDFYLETRWNKLTNEGEFARATYLGRILKGDVVHLELNLFESHNLFDTSTGSAIVNTPQEFTNPVGRGWGNLENNNNHYFNYTFDSPKKLELGIPKGFTHTADGGSNNITVNIMDDSTIAHYYEISFMKELTSPANWKTVILTRDEFDKSGGYITLSRKTKDINNVELGKIEATTPDNLYLVNVKAYGKSYGNVTVSTNSSSNYTVKVTVKDPISGTLPVSRSISFGAVGTKNELQVRINEASGTLVPAEYYLIRYSGPHNDEYTASNSEHEVVGRVGFNVINIGNPSGQITDPGVYKIRVFAVNDNCITQGTPIEAANGEQYFTVNYEKYASQKAYRGKISTALHQVNEALDLEVNFNDGTGWYQLRVGSDFDPDKRMLDCRFNSYAEYNSNKFHVFFKAPAGPQDDPPTEYDVFRGGREEADVYIRTVAKPEYRDTLWLKPKAGDTRYSEYLNYSTDASYIFTQGNMIKENFGSYWLRNIDTDATNIEATLLTHIYGNGTHASVPEGSFGFFDGNGNGAASMTDYFFSPVKHNVFIGKASLTDKLINEPLGTVDRPNPPGNPDSLNIYAFSQIGDTADDPECDRCIRVKGMKANFADNFVVYWKAGTGVGTEDIRSDTSWHNAEVNTDPDQVITVGNQSVPNPNYGKFHYTIRDLVENQPYIVAVTARNGSKVSYPRFWRDTDTAQDDTRIKSVALITPIRPFSLVPPESPNAFSLSLGSDGKSIRVANIYSPGQWRYEVHWITANNYPNGTWTGSGPLENGTISSPGLNPITYWINSLSNWEHYYVRVRALRAISNTPSPWSDAVYIETESVNGTWAGMTAAWTPTTGYNPVRGGLTLAIPTLSLPTGTISYTLNGLVTLKKYNITTTTTCDFYGDNCHTVTDTYYEDTNLVIPIGPTVILNNNEILNYFTGNSSTNVVQAVITFNIVTINQYSETEEHGPFTIVKDRP